MSGNDRASQTIWSLTLAGMVSCLCLVLLPFIHTLQPIWHHGSLPVFCALATVWGYVSHRSRADKEVSHLHRVQVGLVRLTALLACLQLYAILADPTGGALFSFHPQALPYAPLLLVAWLLGRLMAADLGRLGEPPLHDMRYVPPERRLAFGVFAGGAILFLLSGLTHSGLAAGVHVPQVAGSVSLLTVLAYFVCGMVLLGRVRYALLQSRWEDRGMAIAPQLGRRWLASSLLVLALLVLGTLALSGRSDGLQSVPPAVVTQVQHLFAPSAPHQHSRAPSLHQGPYKVTVYQHGGRVYWPWRGIPIGEGNLQRHCCILSEVIVRHSGQLPEGPRGTGSWGLPAPLTITLFTALLITSVLILLYAYRRVRHRRTMWPRGLRSAVTRLGLGKLPASLRAVVRAWHRILGALLTRSRRLVRGNLSRRHPGEGSGQSSLGVGRPGRLAPREQVLYYYVSMLRRARREGLGRKRSQTPTEFLGEMAERLPGVSDDLEVLTEAFIEARYSQHPIEGTTVHRARQSSMHIKSAL